MGRNLGGEEQSSVDARAGIDEATTSSVHGYGDPRFYKLLENMAKLHGAKNRDYAQCGKQGQLGNLPRTSANKRIYAGALFSMRSLRDINAVSCLAVARVKMSSPSIGAISPHRSFQLSTSALIAFIMPSGISIPANFAAPNLSAAKLRTSLRLSVTSNMPPTNESKLACANGLPPNI